MGIVSVEHQVTTTIKLVNEDTVIFMGLLEKLGQASYSAEPITITRDEFKLFAKFSKEFEALKDVIHRFKE